MTALMCLLWGLSGPPKLPPLPGERVVVSPPAAPRRQNVDPAKAPPRPRAEVPAATPTSGERSVKSRKKAAEARPRGGQPKSEAVASDTPSTGRLRDATPEELTVLRNPDATSHPKVTPAAGSDSGGNASSVGGALTGGPILRRTAAPVDPVAPLHSRRSPSPPKRSAAFVIGYRQFEIRDALARQQAWHFVTVEVTPLRRWVRLNILTEVGFEGGEAARRGDRADLIVLEKVGLGAQFPHFVTPFVEFQGGAGVARTEMFDRNEFAFVYTLGVDAGAQWAVTSWFSLHAAVGWIRPVFRYPTRTIRYDRVSFKVGIGF